MLISLQLSKFIYSEKAKNFCEIFPLLLTVCTAVKSKGKVLQNFVSFSEYMNFKNSKFLFYRADYCRSSICFQIGELNAGQTLLYEHQSLKSCPNPHGPCFMDGSIHKARQRARVCSTFNFIKTMPRFYEIVPTDTRQLGS